MKAFQASPGDSKYKENYKACKVCNSRNIYYDLYKPNSMFFLLKKHTVLSHKVFQSKIYIQIYNIFQQLKSQIILHSHRKVHRDRFSYVNLMNIGCKLAIRKILYQMPMRQNNIFNLTVQGPMNFKTFFSCPVGKKLSPWNCPNLL